MQCNFSHQLVFTNPLPPWEQFFFFFAFRSVSEHVEDLPRRAKQLLHSSNHKIQKLLVTYCSCEIQRKQKWQDNSRLEKPECNSWFTAFSCLIPLFFLPFGLLPPNTISQCHIPTSRVIRDHKCFQNPYKYGIYCETSSPLLHHSKAPSSLPPYSWFHIFPQCSKSIRKVKYVTFCFSKLCRWSLFHVILVSWIKWLK